MLHKKDVEKDNVYKKAISKLIDKQSDMFKSDSTLTGYVVPELVEKMFKPMRDIKNPSICVITDYGECVDYIVDTYGLNTTFRLFPTSYFGYQMSLRSVERYTDNPEDFVIFNGEKYSSMTLDKYFEYIMKDYGMLYDCIVGNPPYDGNLHLKIINAVIPLLNVGGIGSFIHPSGWLYNPSKYKLLKHFKIDEYYSQNDCADKFSVTVQSGLVISRFSDDIKCDEYNELYPKYIGRLNNLEIDFLADIKKKILLKKGYDTWANHIDKKDPDKCSRCVTMAQIVGGSAGRSMKLNHNKICTYILVDGIVERGYNHIGERFSDFLDSENKHSYSVIESNPDDVYDYSKDSYTGALQDVLFRYDQHPMYSKYLWMKTWTDDEYYEFFGIEDDRKEIEIIIDKIMASETPMKKSKKKSTHISSSSTKPKSEEEQGQEDADLQSYLLDRKSKEVQED